MSVYSNQGPLRRAQRSASNHSLYTHGSDKSDSPPKKQPEIQAHSKIKEKLSTPIKNNIHHPMQQQHQNPIIIISQEKKNPSRFPQIKSNSNKGLNEDRDKIFNKSFVNDAAQRHALFNEKFNGIQIKEEKVPIPRGNLLFSKSQSRQKERVHVNSAYNNEKIDSRQSKRYIGSNQGSRWFRSQSLNISRQQKSFKYLIRNFHKHNSIMIEQLNRYWEIFQTNQKNLNNSSYKLSIFDTLEALKLKMQSFLERRIILQNFISNGPNAQWNQEQFMNFYSNYKKIYLKQQEVQVHHPYTLKKYKNCVFFGRILDGKKHEGILHYFNGKCFEGKFKDDQKDYGLQIDEKELYLGNYKKGLRHGQGILKTPQSLLVGEFTFGQFSTVAQNRDQSGTTSVLENHVTTKINNYQSRKGFQITHSLFKVFQSGNCIIKNNVGDIYIGSIGEQGQKSQQGLQLFVNGDIYIGRYESDSPEGYGEYYWENNSYYRGQFLSGMRHGRGVWHLINGDSYEGQYMNDKKNGKGTYIWKNGSKYIGNFQNDYRHGYGQMYWQDGRIYKGKWVNGIQKNTIISLQSNIKPSNNGKINNKTSAKVPYRPSFRTIQYDQNNRKKMPIDKLKSLYNPSYQ